MASNNSNLALSDSIVLQVDKKMNQLQLDAYFKESVKESVKAQ